MRGLVLPIVLLGCCVNAQVYFGNRVGMSLGKQVLNDDRPPLGVSEDDGGYRLMGGNAGLTLEWPLNDHFALQTELGYIEKGYRVPEGSDHSPSPQLFRLGYADLSVFFKWSMRYGTVRPEVFAGPVIARELRLRDESWAANFLVLENPITDENFHGGEDDAVDHLAPWEFSAAAGAGLIIQPGVARIHVTYRYLYGITDIYRYEVAYADLNGQLVTHGNLRNYTQMISIGYSIPLSREAWGEAPTP